MRLSDYAGPPLEMGVTLVSYSLLIDVFAATYLQFFSLTSSSAKWQIVCFGLIFNLIVPAVLGWIVVDIREWLAGEGRVLSAIPKAWDEFFKRIGNKPYGLVVTLKDGQTVGGFWAEKPFASSYPAVEDLFIPAPVHIDGDGNFLERIEGAKGLLIARGDILMITAVDPNVAAGTPATPAPKRGECKIRRFIGALMAKTNDQANKPAQTAETVHGECPKSGVNSSRSLLLYSTWFSRSLQVPSMLHSCSIVQ